MENFYPRKQTWIDLVTNTDQSAAAQKKTNQPTNPQKNTIQPFTSLASHTYSIFRTA